MDTEKPQAGLWDGWIHGWTEAGASANHSSINPLFDPSTTV